MRGRKTFGKLGNRSFTPPPPPCTSGGARTEGGKGVGGVVSSLKQLSCQWFTPAFFCGESVGARCLRLPQRRDLLFYCSYTPQKVIWELYYIGGVFFGASSFGRFGRRGKTPNLNQGVFTDTPCVTLSQQESVVASPFALERNHQPCSLMRRRSWRGSRVVRGSPQR